MAFIRQGDFITIRTRIIELSAFEGAAFRRRLTGGHVALTVLP